MDYKEIMNALEVQRKFAVQFFEAWIELVEKNFKMK
jgi:hypothetical protein